MLILGVDAAWSEQNPSGLALIRYESGKKPSLVTVARSYEEFLHLGQDGQIRWDISAVGTKPEFGRILEKACSLGNQQVRVVALDLPLSRIPITKRRACDSEVSRIYGRMGAAVHSPSAKYPGPISSLVFQQLSGAGYELLPQKDQRYTGNGLFMEVYPHIAIIEMLRIDYRLPYKVQKRSSYWRNATPRERLQNLISSIERLRTKLVQEIEGVQQIIPKASGIINSPENSISRLKGVEDVLDAVVCAWMGYKQIIGESVGYGDNNGIIWGPAKGK